MQKLQNNVAVISKCRSLKAERRGRWRIVTKLLTGEGSHRWRGRPHARVSVSHQHAVRAHPTKLVAPHPLSPDFIKTIGETACVIDRG